MSLTKRFRGAAALVGSLILGAAITAQAGHHEKGEMATGNIVEVAAGAGQFNTLIAAAKAAGLADTLANGGPFTVFAPTDAAFAALPAGTVDTLLQPENRDTRATILIFHVLAGAVGSDALADGIQVDTLAEIPATISQTDSGFNIQNAGIVATDIKASNGVVHVIDRVILPPEQSGQVQREDGAPLAIINAAIDQGVPMFNHGNTDATAAIYRIAAQSLVSLASEDMISDASRMRLERGLALADEQRSTRQQAWTLRYALDDVRDELRGDMMQATNL